MFLHDFKLYISTKELNEMKSFDVEKKVSVDGWLITPLIDYIKNEINFSSHVIVTSNFEKFWNIFRETMQ